MTMWTSCPRVATVGVVKEGRLQAPLFEALLAEYPDLELSAETENERAQESSPGFAARTLSQLARAGWEVLDLRGATRSAAVAAAGRISRGGEARLVVVISDERLVGGAPHADMLRRAAAEHRVPVFALPEGGPL